MEKWREKGTGTTGSWYTGLGAANIAVALFVAASLASGFADELPLRKSFPTATQHPGPAPGHLAQQRPPPPDLKAEGEKGRANALDFISWAAAAPKSQDDEIGRLLADERSNQVAAQAFCDEAFRTEQIDHSRALIALSLLGEMRSDLGVGCLRSFVEQPLPERGTVTEGEILERSRLEILEAKAIEGIAYTQTDASDRFVLDVVANHPSRFVRTQAIAAYLFNHDYSAQASEIASKVARADERIFVDRVVRRAGETGDKFNPKVRAFLDSHRDAVPPKPEQREVERSNRFPPPPDFNGRQP